jgi:hypothetical protein
VGIILVFLVIWALGFAYRT